MIRVLFVEDTPQDMILLLRSLKKAGLDVESSRIASLDEIDRALQQNWDVILSDYNLPGFTAIEVLQKIQLSGVATPVIVVSSAVTDESAAEIMRAGASDFVRKENPARLAPAILREIQTAKARQQREEALRTWEHVFQNASWGMSLATPDNRFVSVNRAFAEMHGTSIEEWLGRPVTEMFDEESKARYPALAERANTDGHLIYESTHKRKDGTKFPVLTEVSVFTDSTGSIQYRAANFQDITERKRTEEALRAGERQFRTLADSIPQLAWMAEPSGDVVWYNRKYYDYTGSTFEQLKGWGWQSIHVPEMLPKMLEKWRRSLATGEPWEDVFQMRSRFGEYRWFLSRALPIRGDDGRIVSWFGTNTDINEQLKIEEVLKSAKAAAEEANIAKTRFLANMSHEIRTPLGVMMGFADLARDQGKWNEDVEHYLDTIKRNGEMLTRVIGEVLDLAKIEASKMEIERVRFSLPALLEEIVSFLELQASEKGIRLSLTKSADMPEFLKTDPTRLRQILINLIGNAIKFTERGEVKIGVSLRPTAIPGQPALLAFTVTDTGIGISQAQREKLFIPFSQADSGMTRKYGGSGLGLVLARELAHALGGDIQILDSQPGQGTTFLCTVAAHEVERAHLTEHAASHDGRSGENPAGDLTGISILLVEDSIDNQVLFSRYLKKAGARVDFAGDGRAGVAKTLAEPFDVVLMDIQMPVLNGHEATAELRRQGYKKPIIALTAHALREERERAFNEGFNDYLTKPLNRVALIESILAAVRGMRLEARPAVSRPAEL